MNKTKVIIVEDHHIVRKGLEMLLELNSSIEVVHSFENGKNALAYLDKGILPDIMLTDINMPEMDGIELTRHIKSKFPKIKVIVLTMHLDSFYAKEAIKAGANGYITKGANDEEITIAINKVMSNEVYFDRNIADLMAKSMFVDTEPELTDAISKREKEILKFIVDGFSNKMIADKLSISENTVNTHRYNIMKKLDAKNSAELVRIALKNNLIS